MGKEIVHAATIEQAIKLIRGQRVMLDSDLADLYGVTTMALNQAVKRNRSRFPSDFAFPLTQQEFAALISQIVISKKGRGGAAQGSLGLHRTWRSHAIKRSSFTPGRPCKR